MNLLKADVVKKLSGTEILAVLQAALEDERRQCAALAEGLADRLALSGKHDEAMVAMQVAAQIKARQ